MFFDIIFLVVGMLIGWFFLPVPQWAKTLFAALAAKFPWLAKFTDDSTST